MRVSFDTVHRVKRKIIPRTTLWWIHTITRKLIKESKQYCSDSSDEWEKK